MNPIAMIRFVLPSPLAPSGGNFYNRRILAQLRQAGVPVEPVYVSDEVDAAVLGFSQHALTLWDSLLMDAIPTPGRGSERHHHVLLMHYLPSRNPVLNPADRDAALRREDRAAACVSAFITTGANIAAELRGRYPASPVYVCEPGVDDCFREIARANRTRIDGPVRILTVANLLPAKGLLETLDVLAGIQESPWVWHLVGDDTADPLYAARLRAALEQMPDRDRVIVHGRLSRRPLAELMAQMDLFVLASFEEAYGMAVAEAVAAGLPVIATRVGEVAKLVFHNHNGLLNEVGDWQGFARNLARALGDAGLRRTLSEQARNRPVRGWDATGREFAGICEHLLAGL